MKILINGGGNIGTTIANLMIRFKDLLGISHEYLHKNLPLIWRETDLDFSSADTIKVTDQYTYFRIVTYNYPIRFDSQSKYFLFFLNEKNSEKCKALDKGKYLKLLIC